MIYAAGIKVYSYLDISSITDFCMEVKKGEHGRVTLRGYLFGTPDIRKLQEDPVKITIRGSDDSKEQVLFQGVIQSVHSFMENGVRQVILSALANTIKLDREERSRSFQNQSDTYLKIMKDVSGDVSGSGLSVETGYPVRQYKETDWGRGQIVLRAPEIRLDAAQKIGQYKMASRAALKERELSRKGSGNPATGGGGSGDGAAELQNEYNALSSQGILAGTEYEFYHPFADAPEYESYKEVPTWLKVIGGIAAAAVVGLAVGARVVATGGVGAVLLGVTAVQLGMAAGALTMGAGIAATLGTAVNDKKKGTESSVGDYIRNAFSASTRVGPAVSLLPWDCRGQTCWR